MTDKYLVTFVNNNFVCSNLYHYDDQDYIIVDTGIITRIPKLHSNLSISKFLEETILSHLNLQKSPDKIKSLVYSKDQQLIELLRQSNVANLVELDENGLSRQSNKLISNTFKTDQLNIFIFDDDQIEYIPFRRDEELDSYSAPINMLEILDSDPGILDDLKRIWVQQHGFADKFDLFLDHYYFPEFGVNSEYLFRSNSYYDIYIISKLLKKVKTKLLDAPFLITGDRVMRNDSPKYSLMTFLYALGLNSSTYFYVDQSCIYDNLIRLDTRKGSVLDTTRSTGISRYKTIKLLDKKDKIKTYDSIASFKKGYFEVHPYKDSLWFLDESNDDFEVDLIKGISLDKSNEKDNDPYDGIVIDSLSQNLDRDLLASSIEHLLDHFELFEKR